MLRLLNFIIVVSIVSVLTNGESIAQAEEREFEGTSELSSLITNGNTRNQTTGLGLDLTYRPAPWLVNAKSKYLTTVSQDVQTQESFEASGRGARSLTESFDVFVEHQFLKNRFAGTEKRNTTTGGAGYFWLKDDWQKLRTELALGYTDEERTDGTKPGFMTGVAGLMYGLKLSPTADLNHETKYLPNFANSEDWRMTTETSLSAAINSVFSSKIAWKYEHVNMPPAGKIRGDTTTTVSLLAKF